MNVVALALEERVRVDTDLDEGVARRSAERPRRSTLAFQTQRPSVLNPGGDRHVERSVAERDASLAAVRRLQERDAKHEALVGAARAAPGSPSAAAARRAAEELAQYVLAEDVAEVGAAAAAASAPAARAAAAAAEAERGPFGSVGVDLTAVEARPLLRIREQVVGGRDLLELLLDALVGVEVRVQLLREPAVGCLDVLRRSVSFEAQYLVRISHADFHFDDA